MSLLERTRTADGLCVSCGAHPPIPDGNRCRGCLEAYLRETRPASLRTPESPWVTAARERRLPAVDLTRSAA